MAILPMCDLCDKELTEMGAILLSPPVKQDVKKYHLCLDCYQEISKDLITR